ETHQIVERGRAQAGCARAARAEYLIDGRVGKGGEPPHALRQTGEGRDQPIEGLERCDRVDPRVLLSDHELRTPAGEESPVQIEWIIGSHLVSGVAAPTRSDDVETAIPIQVAGRDPVPTTRYAGKAGERCGRESLVLIEEHPEITPIDREDPVGPAVAVHVREMRRGLQAA